MKKYDKEIMQAQLDNEKAVLKQLESNYKDALEEINSKIANLMARADADMQHVIYQVEYQKALKKQIEGILLQLQTNEFDTVSAYLTKSYEEGFLGTMYAMQSQGVPLVFPINQEEVVAAIQHETALTKSLYEAFDMKDLQKKIAGEISRGFSTGALYKEVARNVQAVTGISKNKAMRIARTEGHRITETAAHNAQLKAKERGADVVKIWDATLDSKTRDSHARVDGEIKEVEEKFSNGLMYPGDSSGEPGEVINCRCRSRTDARWALEADETKMLGDTSKMTDAQKKRIADKLGIPVEDLDQYSGQIVPINAKNYADFKRQYDQLWRYEGSALQKEVEPRIAKMEQARTGKKSSEKSNKTLESSENSDKISAGAISGAYNSKNDPMGIKREAHAKQYYSALRNSDKENVVAKIAANAEIDAESVAKMYNHLFINKYDLEKGHSNFDPDYDIAESLQRLREGKGIQEHDRILILHEAMEHDLMNNDGLSYEEAHGIANASYNYQDALNRWLDKNEG